MAKNITQGDLKALEEKFRDMLKLQASSYQDSLKIFVDSTNKRIDTFITNFAKDISEVKVSLEYTQKEVDELKQKINLNETSMSQITSAITSIESNNVILTEQAEYLDNYSRRNSLRVEGLPEGQTAETWESTEANFRTLVKEKLGLHDDIEVERAHRIGQRREDKHRSVAVKLLRYKDKERIIKRASNLAGTGIYINQSYSDKVMKKRNELWPIVKAERAKGKFAYIQFDKLVVKDRNPWERAPQSTPPAHHIQRQTRSGGATNRGETVLENPQ